MKLFQLGTAFVLTLSLQGCFFFFIPGSAIQAVADGISGAEGEHCVSEQAKIGDKIRGPNGTVGTIKSLSGKSGRCSMLDMPIRAKLEFTAL